MGCFQQEGFANAFTFQEKNEGADVFAEGAWILPESGLGWQLPWEKLYHSLISTEYNLMTVSKTSHVLSLSSLHLQAFQHECRKVWLFFFPSPSKAIPNMFCAVILCYSESEILSSAAGSMIVICIDLCHIFLSSETTGKEAWRWQEKKKADQELLLDCNLPGCCGRNTAHWLFGDITFQPPTRSWSTCTNGH